VRSELPLPIPVAHYRVIILTVDRFEDADLLETEIFRLAPLSGGRRAKLEVSRDASILAQPPRPDDPATVAVFLSGGSRAAKDASILQSASDCLDNLVAVLPVFNPTVGKYPTQFPKGLHPINGAPWVTGDPPSKTATQVLKLLGLSEDDQRIFISYRQTDSARIADQLRTHLLNERWDVFLDRFSIPPGVDFQKRLDRELADKAFVVLLETPNTTDSEWLEHEVAFALQRKLGLLAVTFPETTPDQLHPAIDDAWRLRLAPEDLEGTSPNAQLSGAAVDKVLLEIHQRHSNAYTLRREGAMLEAAQELRAEGYHVVPIDQWGLLGTKSNMREVAFVTARAPEAKDIRIVDTLRTKHRNPGIPTRGWVVHPMEDIDTDRTSLLQWMTTYRRINTAPLMLFAKRMQQ
jgi:hypothetical protein